MRHITAAGNRCQIVLRAATVGITILLRMAKKPATKIARLPAKAAAEPRSRSQPTAVEVERKHTINDIARLANVSKKTVSRVINESPFVREETRSRINEIIRRTGFTPDPQARGLAFRRSYLIGLASDNPNAPYVINVQEGALAALRRVGYELVVHPCDRTSPEFLNDIRQLVSRQKLDGMLLLPPVSENPMLAELLRDLHCPYIRIL